MLITWKDAGLFVFAQVFNKNYNKYIDAFF